ncbi:MAG TPA: hypothetical protein VFK06_06355 [Candidatus Angelobacter sp.]|nr:hypothetical protein [Candidatus Angelobacter sp.]
MAVYTYSEEQIERMVEKVKRLRVWLTVAVVLIPALVLPLAYFRPDWAIFHQLYRFWIVAFILLVNIIQYWRRGPELLRTSLRNMEVEVTPNAITASYPLGYKIQLSPQEVIRAQDPSFGTGLYLRTANRYQSILVQRKFDNYAAIHQQLNQMGIPVVKTLFPPNCEGYVFVLLFVGTMLCAITAHSIPVLTANLILSVLVAGSGLFLINANPGYPQIRKARIGIFIPVVAAALELLLALKA